ncbi:ATP-binding protein [Acidiferrimicrobium sp. IK]|uniref:ATP-binding protein n=1 Tax=Acidiferrimicrobium sp. IK TaxID=2871700 RepID=UPI0021CAEE79|nr:ATP-binding protein [Acidiferrimicrobium sp. IK]MCU4183073.1 ATP-binding protein [Acidiferrimicrobium sp. IK]
METVPPPQRPGDLGEVTPVVLPVAPASARLARQHIQSVTGRPEDGRIALIVTELVNNAVLHARSRPRLRAAVVDGVLTVEVFDDGPGLPVLRPLDDSPTVSGRGLALVDALATSWGVTPDPSGTGKTVWATIALD